MHAECAVIPLPGELPAALQAALQSIGPVVAPPATEALLAPLHPAGTAADVAVERDVAYGPDPRHLLDIFRPAPHTTPPSRPMPVLLFVHGGAFMRGDRRIGNGPFHDNIGLWAARQGMVGVNMTYRLAPQHGWPAAQQDIARALQWLRSARAGSELFAGPVVLVGHSAGAAHVAQYLAHDAFHPPGGPGVAGAVLLSGLFDPATAEHNPPLRAYFGPEPERYPAMSALPGLVGSQVPLWLGYAEWDPPDFVQQAQLLGSTLQQAGRAVPVHLLSGHSHMSEIYTIGTEDEALTRPLAAFIRRVSRDA